MADLSPDPPDTGSRWSSRSLGKRWQYAFFRGLLRAGGRPVAHGFADLVAAWYVLAKPEVRDRCAPYLSRRFPERRGGRRLVDVWRLSRSFAHVLVDRAALALLREPPEAVASEGAQALLALAAEGRGLVLLTAHVGAWQLGMAHLPRLGVPVTVVMHRDPGDRDRPSEPGGGMAPFRLLDPAQGGSLALLAELERGGALCLMGDRVMPGTGGSLTVDFLGGPIALPFGPFRLAAATGAPMAICFFTGTPAGGAEVDVATVLRFPEDLGRKPEAYRPYAQAYADALEAYVAREPYRFFNFFDLWST